MTCVLGTAQAQIPEMDCTRARPLDVWKRDIAEYSLRHYGEKEWRLVPRCIILHYTAGKSFPKNLVEGEDFAGERPALASHYILSDTQAWEIIPPNVRCRAAYGINHRGISIEMIAADGADLIGNHQATLDQCVELVVGLIREFDIPISEIYSHQQVATMNPTIVPWVYDLIEDTPYDKSDPGQAAMAYVLERVRERFGE
jgi:hypothetical protein